METQAFGCAVRAVVFATREHIIELDTLLESLQHVCKQRITQHQFQWYLHRRFCCSGSVVDGGVDAKQNPFGYCRERFVRGQPVWSFHVRATKHEMLKLFGGETAEANEEKKKMPKTLPEVEEEEEAKEKNTCSGCTEHSFTTPLTSTQRMVDGLAREHAKVNACIEKLKNVHPHERSNNKEFDGIGINNECIERLRAQEDSMRRLHAHRLSYEHELRPLHKKVHVLRLLEEKKTVNHHDVFVSLQQAYPKVFGRVLDMNGVSFLRKAYERRVFRLETLRDEGMSLDEAHTLCGAANSIYTYEIPKAKQEKIVALLRNMR